MRKKLLAFTLAFAMLLSTFSGMSALAAPSSLPELTSVDELSGVTVQTQTSLADVVAQLPTEVGVTLASTESTVLFEDDFSNPDQSRAKWALADPNGVVTFETGKMKLGATDNVKAVASPAGTQDWTNYAVEAKITGPENPGNNFGVMFRCADVTTTGPDSYKGYYAGIGSTTAGPGFVAGYADGGWHQIATDPAPGYTGGKTYTMKVLVAGNSFHVYLDGTKVYEYTDANNLFASGTAGVRAYQVPFEVTSFVVRTLTPDECTEMGSGAGTIKATASISGWSCPEYDMDTTGEYTFTGSLSGDFTNAANKVASVKVTVVTDVTPEYDTTTPITIIANKNEGVAHDVNPYIKGNQMYLFMPAKADLSALNVTALADIVLNGVNYAANSTVTLDLSENKTMTLVTGGSTYTLSAMQSKLPTLYLNIDESQGTIAAMNGDPAHDTKCYGDLVLDVPADLAAEKGWPEQYALDLKEIKGRGNSTWNQIKKPYQFKLNDKTNMLGMGKHKTWIILANYMDSSLIRNRLVYNAGAEADMEYPTGNEYIDVYMNGKYLGNYQLTEKVEVGTNRVEVTDIDSIVEDTGALPENITGGYLLEMDFRARNEAYHFSTPKFYHLEVKSPEMNGPTLDYISQYVCDFENALYSADGYNDKGIYYADYIDLDSFVTYYFFQEFIKNWDCMYSYGSIYFHKDVDGPLIAGPFWDFDWTMDARHVPDYKGLFHTTEGWLGQIVDRSEHTGNEMWWRQFWKHEDFVIRLTELYEEKLSGIVAGWPEDIAAYNEELGVSATMNDIMWPYNLSHQDNVQSITNFSKGRYEWIDNAVKELPVASFLGGEGATGDAPASLYAEKDETFKLPANTFEKAGFEFAGWSDGSNTYAAEADYTKAIDGRLILTAVWNEIITPADKTELSNLYNANKDKVTADYTAESWSAFKAALDAAEAVLEKIGATATEIETAYAALEKAVGELVEVEQPTDVDKSMLEALITAVDGKYEAERYTEASYTALIDALEAAQGVVDDKAATQKDVFDAYLALVKARDSLVYAVDTSLLELAIELAQGLLDDENLNLTDESVAALEDAIASAQNVLEKTDATQEEINASYEDVMGTITEVSEQEPVDKSVLEKLLKMAAEVARGKYTTSSLKALDEAVDAAEPVMTDDKATEEQVKAAEAALTKALNQLQLKANFAILESAVATAQEIVEKAEDQTALVEVKELLAEAETLLANDEATQEEINELAAKLTKAAALVRLAEVVKSAETNLAALNAADYTAESWNVLESAVAELKGLEENEELTVELVNAANEVVLAAFNGLEPAEEAKPDPKPVKPTKGSASSVSDSDYWTEVIEKINATEKGGKVNAKLDEGGKVPATVIDAAKNKGVTVVFTIGDKDYAVNGAGELKGYSAAAVYYTSAEIKAMAGNVPAASGTTAANSNPETGGEVPAIAPAAPESVVPAEPVVPEAPAVIEPVVPAEPEAPAAQAASETETGLPVWAIVVMAIAASAVVGSGAFVAIKRNRNK